ncbi:uncharacterized protein VTP21DRAFT_6027 [Calcarisporiella thermophila]|uniref:uncharacterized protein n=1 Tax=Calcarisporiella thermophila TaxID=911321 RepID=UPI0037448B1C
MQESEGFERQRESIFDPPLWRQRREWLARFLWDKGITKVMDLGCGEGSLLDYLLSVRWDIQDLGVPRPRVPMTRLVGVDVSSEALNLSTERCSPDDEDRLYPRWNPLSVELYQGSLVEVDDRMRDIEAIVCCEVIEHLPEHSLVHVLDSVLGGYAPRFFLVTTPNVEYNPCLGMQSGTMRHPDHKFEWTREEFQVWCKAGAEKHGYAVEFTGVGGEGSALIGFCTQIAVFRAKEAEPRQADPLEQGNSRTQGALRGGSGCPRSLHTPLQLVWQVAYPTRTAAFSDADIMERVDQVLPYLLNPVSDGAAPQLDRLPLPSLWQVKDIRYRARTVQRLIDVLLRSEGAFQVTWASPQLPEEAVVHVTRAYPLPSSADDFEEMEEGNGYAEEEEVEADRSESP